MQRYGTEVRLLKNQLYTVTLTVRGQQKVVSFTSRYNPLFSTVRVIRSDFRDLFSAYTDDDINRVIHDNSKLAIEIAKPKLHLDKEIPYYVRQYVRYKTELDLATDLFLTLTTESGQADKQLGDLRVMKQVQLPKLQDILKVLEQRLAAWEAQLVGMKAPPTSAVRAGNTTPYPLNARVGF